MADQDFDRSEPATPYRLDKARKEGTVSKSAEVTPTAILAVAATVLSSAGWESMRNLAVLQQQLLAGLNRTNWDIDSTAAWISAVVIAAMSHIFPFLAAIVAVAVVTTIIQTGPVLSFKPITPDWNRLNPVDGFKRIFSMRIVYEAAKSCFKAALLLGAIGFVVTGLMPDLLVTSARPPASHVRFLLESTSGLMLRLVLILVVIAAIDFLYSRWTFARKMRMSRRDIRDEQKHREGDPRIRARLREIRREMLKRSQGVRNVASADVLITNPTHIAVALGYRQGESPAPRLIAKGAGELASKMRIVARQHGIPVVENRPLARALFREAEQDAYVPEKFYPQLAKILVWVQMMRRQRAPGGQA